MSRSSDTKNRTKKRLIIVLSTVLVLLLALGGAGVYLWSQYGERVSLAMGWTTNDYEGEGHGEAIVTIRESAAQVVRVVHDIADAMSEQGAASQDIARRVENVAQASEENNAAARQTADSAGILKGLAGQLKRTAGQFRIS